LPVFVNNRIEKVQIKIIQYSFHPITYNNMHYISRNLKYLLLSMTMTGMVSCSNNDPDPVVETPLRTKVEYSALTPTTAYNTTFVDADNKTTVDLTNGNNRYKMFQALNTHISSSVTANRQIDAAVLKNMFSNTGNPFEASELNSSGLQLKSAVASSWASAEADVVRTRFELLFAEQAEISKSVANVAEIGKAGKAGTYLVNAQGIEVIQIIQKSLIGALQYDYIGNNLLTKGLDADNKTVLAGKNYTQLEQNWDEAYGLLTLNPIYLAGSTDAVRGTTEFALGSYIWEYNKTAYPKIYPAFLKGRAAIVNNDKAELKTQADYIKGEMEKAIASAAVGYLGKFITSTTDAARVHAMGEGLGFIYSLRFATINGGTSKFSDDLITGLVGSANGVWDLTPAKISAASDAIKAKFKL
jgi:hypothetical protein